MDEEWQRAIESLPSETFLNLCRLYLGKINTPFRKHELLLSLDAFLRRQENIDMIVSLMDNEDCLIYTAVKLLDGPNRSDLLDFIDGDRLKTLSRVANLEERLVLYERISASGSDRTLHPSPQLVHALDRYAFEPGLLFSLSTNQPFDHLLEPSSDNVRKDPIVIAAFVSFFLSFYPFIKRKTDGGIKPNTNCINSFITTFSDSFDCEGSFRILLQLGFFYESGRGFLPDYNRISLAINDETAFQLQMAELISGQKCELPLLLDFLSGLSSSDDFPAASVLRLIGLIATKERNAVKLSASAATSLISAFVKVGLLEFDNNTFRPRKPSEITSNRYRIGSDFHICVDQNVPIKELFTIALSGEIFRFGSQAEFIFTRQSVGRAYRAGVSREYLSSFLRALAGNDLPQNVSFSFMSWEKEHHSVLIAQGIVIVGDERLSRFMEHSPVIKPHVIHRLSQGVYLTNFDTIIEAEAGLREAGFETPPQLFGTAQRPIFNLTPQNRLVEPILVRNYPHFAQLSSVRENPPMIANEIVKSWLEEINSVQMDPDTKRILIDRLRLKIIVGSKEFDPHTIKPEKLEAKGLDYVGKLRLIEKAIQSTLCYLELHYSELNRSVCSIVRPISLQKKAGSSPILECIEETSNPNLTHNRSHVSIYLDPLSNRLNIPVEKIAKLCLIRLSLFF